MPNVLTGFIVSATLVIGMGLTVPRVSADVTDAQVREAIRGGIEFLYQQQGAWGHWDEQNDTRVQGANHAAKQWGGTTALAVYALLATGEEWQENPKITPALKYLAEADLDGTYAVGLRAHVWTNLPDKFQPFHQNDAYLLVEGMNTTGTYGGYRYTLGDSGYDNSCVQYGVLGAWECAKRGVPIPRSYWERVESHFMANDRGGTADGGWAYQGSRDAPTLNMTSAGLAMLYITLDYLHSEDFSRPGVTPRHPVYQRILRGLEAYDTLYRPTTEGYSAVGIERVGLASGRKFFKGQDWYQQIATQMVRGQRGGQLGSGSRGAVVNTSFALVFLARGRVPVMVNKLEIDNYEWDNRPRDMANLARWASDEFEIPLNWQIVNINTAPETWLDAPMLYMSGHRPLELDEAQLAKLKRYIDLGGTLVLNPDGGTQTFVQSAKAALEQLYPYSFARVDANDDLYNIHFRLRDQQVETLHNGVRHLAIILPRDSGLTWQLNNFVRDQTPWHLMGNIFQYAIEKAEPRPRLETHYVSRTGSPGRSIHIGRAKYDGNWDAEPLAWEMVDTFAANDNKARIRTHELDLSKIAGQDVSMVHVAGTQSVTFTDEQIAAIKQFVNDDKGVILFEAIGGQPAFSESVLNMLRQAFPGDTTLPRRLLATDGLLTGRDISGGYDNAAVGYRWFYNQRMGTTATQPGLQAIFFDGQPRIIISREDLSAGALGQPIWGVFGYDAESSRKLMAGMALFAAQTKPAQGNIQQDGPQADGAVEEVAAD